VTLKEVYDRQKEKSMGMSGMMRRGFAGASNYLEKDSMHMDVDDAGENSKGKNRKCVLLASAAIAAPRSECAV
jgi:hypothetical protein